MSTDEYAWTDEQARKFTAPCVDRWQWDAWLAAHDARVRRDAWDEGGAHVEGRGGYYDPDDNPHRETGDSDEHR